MIDAPKDTSSLVLPYARTNPPQRGAECDSTGEETGGREKCTPLPRNFRIAGDTLRIFFSVGAPMSDPGWKQVAIPERVQAARRMPPGPVVLVALSQFTKATFILFFVTMLWRNREGLRGQGQFPSAELILYAALAILVAIAASFLRNGIGLLRLDKSSRRRVMWNIVEGWVIYGVSFSGVFFGESPFISSWPNRIVVSILIVDLILYSCLAFYPDLAKAFGESDESDELLP